MGRFDGQVAIVTGSSTGIGAATASLIASEGGSVVINARSSGAGEELAASLPSAIFLQGDVAVEEDAHRIVDGAVEHFGRLDILVNNAGATARIAHADLDAVTGEVWEKILSTNVVGNWYVTRAATPALRASGRGAIVNVASVAGLNVGGSSIPYAVSKAAIIHMTRLLAVALAPDIRINAVAPGLVHTPWTEAWGVDFDSYGRENPTGSIVTPDDVATVIIGLIESRAVTGEVIPVDGGRHWRGFPGANEKSPAKRAAQ